MTAGSLSPSRQSSRVGLLSTALLAASILASPTAAQTDASDPLRTGFTNPPASARPRVWWHWMNGNVTKEGIRKDLEWMKRSGIGGLQNFDANLITPKIVQQRLVYMTPQWKDAFRYAAGLAEELDLELAIAASPGWSETGGPWVPPQDGLKKLVWSETAVEGGKRFVGKLANPPSVAGPFQDMPVGDDVLAALSGNKKFDAPAFYSDVAVLAYRAEAAEPPGTPRIMTGGKPLDVTALTDDSFTTGVEVARGKPEQPSTILIDYDRPQTIRSLSIFLPGAASTFTAPGIIPRLEASEDGSTWRNIVDVALSTAPTTVSFPAVTARHFRVVLAPNPNPAGLDFAPAPGADVSLFAHLFAPKPTIELLDLRLSSHARINQFETKAGFSLTRDYYGLDQHVGPEVKGVPAGAVIDLTGGMKPDGTLDWTPPPGRWRVLRLGYSLTGKINHPATEEATGLEVDKFDGRAVRDYLEHYISTYRETVGADLIGDKGLRAIVTDSIEVGASNWTPRLLDQFQRLRGYDPRPWLPALTGVVVGSRAQSDAFLYDYRRTLADLIATEHYGTVAQVAHENGLLVYGEALEGGRPSLGDDIAMRRYADVPMAALWTYPRSQEPRAVFRADMKGASSTAHLYGQRLVAAESMTSALNPWAHSPADLRRVIDFEFASGINRPVIHTSVHQPLDDKVPGLSLSIFGQFFNRHETWAEMARPWMDYLARNSFMLQQGRDVADVAYFYGEESPIVGQAAKSFLPGVPTRYAFDFVNPDAVSNLLKVENGDLVAPSGARYRLLYLGGTSDRMTLPMLRRIAALAEQGATIVGKAPAGSPSLNDDPKAFDALVRRLWSGQPVTRIGQGRVIASNDVESALASIGVDPDFSYAKPQPDSDVMFVHRRVPDGDIYFVNNRRNRAETIEAQFRVAGKAPEIWRADTGLSEPVSFRVEGGRTIVPLELAAEDSFFVVFRQPATSGSVAVAKPGLARVAEIYGPWSVSFQPGRGAPASVTLPALDSLSEHGQPGVKYFSGVASYSKSFMLPKSSRPGEPLWLDLGQIGDVAEVHVNGKRVGTVWHAPYRIDIGGAVKRGTNQLQVRVANLWVNRLIGDAQPGAEKASFTAIPTYRADAPLRPSGLIGPVRLFAAIDQ